MAKRKTASKRKYGKKSQSKVRTAMRKMKKGTLKSGRSKKKVTSRKQAIAIGLSEARNEGAKVPSKAKKSTKRKSTAKRKTTSKSAMYSTKAKRHASAHKSRHAKSAIARWFGW